MGGREEELVGQKILFSAYHKKVPARGQKCRVSGELKVLHDPFPMERFDFFLWVNGVRYKMPYVRSCRLNRRCPETLFGALNRRCENILSAHVEDGVPAKAYKAMILGRKEHLEPSVYHYFLLTGTLHLFAVSGLHVGVIAAVAFCLFRLLPLPMSIRYVLALALVAGYVFVVGASPSTLRAFVMVCTLMVARLLYRRAHVEGALLTSLFFVLLTRPKQLLDVGFQLSYGIVGALVWLGTPLDIYLQRICTTPYVPKPPFSRARWTFEAVKIWLIHSFAISSAATVFSQILMAYYWRYTTPLALLLNVCVVPLASFAVACGGCALLFGMIAPVLSLHGCFNVVAVTTVRILVRILSWASSWPLAKVDVSFSLPVTVLCAGLFFAAALFFDHFVHRNDCAQTRLGWT
jgi:competence protein ComEC